MATYRVVLTGVQDGLDASQVAAKLAVLCKIPVEGASVLLASPSMVLKGTLDARMAAEYKVALQSVGCKARVEREGGASTAASHAPRSAGGRYRVAVDAQQVRACLNALARYAKSTFVGIAALARRSAARAGEQRNSVRGAGGSPSPSLAPVAQAKATGAGSLAAPQWAKKYFRATTLIVAGAAIATVAIAGFVVGTRSSGGGPCPGEYDVVRWTNCVGEVTFPNGEKYVGALKDGEPHGQGAFTWPNGERYVGGWKDGRRNGQGTFIWPDGTKYVGGFRNNRRHGSGVQTFANGRTYVGEFKDGKPIKETMQR